MTSSVTNSAPYSYYNVLNPTTPEPGAPEVATTDTSAADTDTSDSTTPTPSTSGVQLSSNVLSLLQQLLSSDNSSSDPTTELLGGGSSTNDLNGLLNQPQGGLRANTYTTLLSAAYSGANQKASAAAIANSGNYIQNVLNDYQNAQNAFNTTPTAAEVQAVIDANSYLPDGTKITA